jgi:hypothetical protein
MPETSVVFADRLLNVAVTGPLVRLQWGVMGVPQAEGEKPALRVSQTLVLPLDGLLASMAMIDGLVKQLVKDGVLRPQTPDTTPANPLR